MFTKNAPETCYLLTNSAVAAMIAMVATSRMMHAHGFASGSSSRKCSSSCFSAAGASCGIVSAFPSPGGLCIYMRDAMYLQTTNQLRLLLLASAMLRT